MKYGIHFGHWGNYYDVQSIEKTIGQIKQTGADSFEFFPTAAMLEGDKKGIYEFRALLKEYEMEPIFTFGYPQDWDILSEDILVREKAIRYLEKAIEGIGILGGKKIGGILYGNWPADYTRPPIEPEEKEKRTQRCVKVLKRIVKTAEMYDVTLSLEIVNRFEHFLINTVEEGKSICDRVDSKYCKLLLDCFHMNIEEDDIAQSIRNAKGYIGHFHVSEPNRKVPNRCSHINWIEIGNALRETGYEETVILEPFYKFGGKQGHDMRMWRDLDTDLSVEHRILLAKQGIRYIREKFGGI